MMNSLEKPNLIKSRHSDQRLKLEAPLPRRTHHRFLMGPPHYYSQAKKVDGKDGYLAKIVGHATHSIHPSEFTLAPIGAITSLLNRLEWPIESVDLFEINEAFAW